MGYYTDYIIECDLLAFSRMLDEWREKRGDYETELPRPHYIWEKSKTCPPDEMGEVKIDCKYLMYFCINHGPYAGDVDDWLCITLGLDERHFVMKVKAEDEKEWWTYGAMTEIGGYAFKIYDKATGKLKGGCIPDGWLKYEYCCIAINPKVWTTSDVDYTRDNIKPGGATEDTLKNIAERLEHIEDILSELNDSIKNG